MADDEAAEGASSGGSKLLIIILAIVLVLLIGGGAAVYFVVLPKIQQTEGKTIETAEKEKAAPAVSLGSTIELQPFIVNLSGGGGRYLKTTMVLQLSTPDVAKEITNRAPQIKDAVITILSSKTADEIMSVQGKYDLKTEIMRRVNTFLSTGVVRELFFVEFVVQ